MCRVRVSATGRGGGGFATCSAMATAGNGHCSQQPITDLIGSNLVLDPRTEKVRSGGGFNYLRPRKGRKLPVTDVRVMK